MSPNLPRLVWSIALGAFGVGAYLGFAPGLMAQ